ncbi:hypothetical protein EMQ25_15740 [Arsenicitalea aurantiaca]|uniref:Anti-sigma factor n=1 Tax=Arsenicitalea aurantiaca TaxID=1783274 RepID=A0A433X447_9HYPH|nr:hypothetical protein [Arsenicitalea aurantiaca]RUT28840.1 hypothetical protein EMQ25_15740 [Arsenicitalea aurantiaca]
MNPEDVTDEMLMAFVDGELEPEEAERIAALSGRDSGIGTRIARFERSRAAVAGAFGAVRSEPAPDWLVHAALGATPIASARRAADTRKGFGQRLGAFWSRDGLAVAASLVLVAGLGGYLASGLLRSEETPFLARATSPELLDRLALARSGETVRVAQVSATPIGSYPVAGGICRIYEANAQAGAGLRALACHVEGQWRVPLAVRQGNGQSYQTASAAALGAVDAYLDSIEAGSALSANEEAARIAAGW